MIGDLRVKDLTNVEDVPERAVYTTISPSQKKTESERDKSDDEHMGVAKRERKKERALESYLLLVMMMRIGRHLTTGMWIPMRQFANENGTTKRAFRL